MARSFLLANGEIFGPILFFMAVGAFVLLSVAFSSRRSHDIIDEWAESKGLTVTSKERRMLMKGPFFFASHGQTVYYVTVRNSEGRQRSAYVKCGGFFLGLFSDQIDVRWDGDY